MLCFVVGIKAICCLASLNYECRVAIGNANGCELLIETLNNVRYSSGTSTPVSSTPGGNSSTVGSPTHSNSHTHTHGHSSSFSFSGSGKITNGLNSFHRNGGSTSSLMSATNNSNSNSNPAAKSSNSNLMDLLNSSFISANMKQLLQGSSVSSDGCEAIMHLALCPQNSDRLGEIGACELIVNKLCPILLNVPFGAEVCTGAMLNLITYGNRTKENRMKLLEANAIDMCGKLQMSPKASCRARDNIAQIIDYLSAVGKGDQEDNHNSDKPRSQSISSVSSTTSVGSGVFVGVVNSSEAKGGMIPLAAELREYNEVSKAGLTTPLLFSTTTGDTMEDHRDDDSNSNNQSGIYEI